MAIQVNLANVLLLLADGQDVVAAKLTCKASPEVAVDIALNVAKQVSPQTLQAYHDAIRAEALSG